MKKIENMNIDEARQAFSKFEAKHARNDDLDMSGLQLTRYAERLEKANREELFDLISDIFNHGFMCGYKQSEADLKAKIDKRMHDDMHRRLLELVYYLPFGYQAGFFYNLIIFTLPEDAFRLMPKKQAKPALAIRAERETKKAREKAEHEERKKVVDEALKQYEQRNKALEEKEVC